MRVQRFNPACISGGDAPNIVWDSVFLFAPGEQWTEAPPQPAYCGRTILRALSGLREALCRRLNGASMLHSRL
jgi:hypothetical protein